MTLPRTILVPVDFGANSEDALDYAVELAGKLDAKLYILNVIALPGLGIPELGAGLAPGVIDSMVRDSEAALAKLADARRSKAQIADTLLRTGDARDVIVNTVEDVAADLIVMGTHGRRGVTRALLGSVAESVLRTAPCPVLTIRGRKR
jgi:nucleotide-binding universal stress UspA family protein